MGRGGGDEECNANSNHPWVPRKSFAQHGHPSRQNVLPTLERSAARSNRDGNLSGRNRAQPAASPHAYKPLYYRTGLCLQCTPALQLLKPTRCQAFGERGEQPGMSPTHEEAMGVCIADAAGRDRSHQPAKCPTTAKASKPHPRPIAWPMVSQNCCTETPQGLSRLGAQHGNCTLIAARPGRACGIFLPRQPNPRYIERVAGPDSASLLDENAWDGGGAVVQLSWTWMLSSLWTDPSRTTCAFLDTPLRRTPQVSVVSVATVPVTTVPFTQGRVQSLHEVTSMYPSHPRSQTFTPYHSHRGGEPVSPRGMCLLHD